MRFAAGYPYPAGIMKARQILWEMLVVIEDQDHLTGLHSTMEAI
jgi:hypothetical protein